MFRTSNSIAAKAAKGILLIAIYAIHFLSFTVLKASPANHQHDFKISLNKIQQKKCNSKPYSSFITKHIQIKTNARNNTFLPEKIVNEHNIKYADFAGILCLAIPYRQSTGKPSKRYRLLRVLLI
jgi:hypothetical protein